MKNYLQIANEDIAQSSTSYNECTGIPENPVSIVLPENIENFLLEQTKSQKVLAILVKDENNIPMMVTPSDVTITKRDMSSEEVAVPRGKQCCTFVLNGVLYAMCF